MLYHCNLQSFCKHTLYPSLNISNSVNTACRTPAVAWYIVVSTVCGFIFGILVSYILRCFLRKLGSQNPPTQSDPFPHKTEENSTYQELDMSKMNTEDNYQSLRGDVAKIQNAPNDDDSTYTELSKTRDVESNYQSLIST